MSSVLNIKSHLPDDPNKTFAYTGCAVYREHLVECLCGFFVTKSRNYKVENTIERCHDQNEHVAVVLHFVDRHDEAVSLEEDRHQKGDCRALNHLLLRHSQSAEHEVALSLERSQVFNCVRHISSI